MQPSSIVDGLSELIGNTPLVRIRSLSELTGCEVSTMSLLLSILEAMLQNHLYDNSTTLYTQTGY